MNSKLITSENIHFPLSRLYRFFHYNINPSYILYKITLGEEPAIIGQFLWGPAENRWVDKSFSVIVSDDGQCGLNFEHAWGDGACVLAFFNKTHEHILEMNPIRPGEGSTDTGFGFTEPNEVHFILDDQMKNTISNARQYYADHIDGLVIAYTRVST